MTKENTTAEFNMTREQMIQLLNEDLAGEYQAIIAYTVYSQVLNLVKNGQSSRNAALV